MLPGAAWRAARVRGAGPLPGPDDERKLLRSVHGRGGAGEPGRGVRGPRRARDPDQAVLLSAGPRADPPERRGASRERSHGADRDREPPSPGPAAVLAHDVESRSTACARRSSASWPRPGPRRWRCQEEDARDHRDQERAGHLRHPGGFDRDALRAGRVLGAGRGHRVARPDAGLVGPGGPAPGNDGLRRGRHDPEHARPVRYPGRRGAGAGRDQVRRGVSLGRSRREPRAASAWPAPSPSSPAP